MELKKQIDRLRDEVQLLTIPAIVLSIIMTGTLLWKVQQDNVDLLQSKIEHLKKEIAHPSSTNEKLKLEEMLKLEKDILVIDKDKTTIQNGVYTTLVQALGGVILSITAYVGYCNFKIGEKNLKATEDKQVTERFSKSIEHLGSDKIDVRLGGIYALEQISIDSAKYHWTIVEILSAFIREKRPLDNTERVSIDIQASLTVIGRRKAIQDPPGKYIDFRKVNLAGVEIQNTNLSGSNFSEANLSNTNFSGTNLSNTNFRKSNLSNTHCCGADFTSANLSDANLSDANLSDANLSNANCFRSNLSRADLIDANLSNAWLFKTDVLDVDFSFLVPVDLKNVDLSECLNLTCEQLS